MVPYGMTWHAPPETSYVNASRVKFEGCKQEFIASQVDNLTQGMPHYSITGYINYCSFLFQAPKALSFNHFWHMVVQEKVAVIMMITAQTEGKKRKADQYWPSEENMPVNTHTLK